MESAAHLGCGHLTPWRAAARPSLVLTLHTIAAPCYLSHYLCIVYRGLRWRHAYGHPPLASGLLLGGEHAAIGMRISVFLGM